MRVYHDFFFGTRIQINVSWYGSGSETLSITITITINIVLKRGMGELYSIFAGENMYPLKKRSAFQLSNILDPYSSTSEWAQINHLNRKYLVSGKPNLFNPKKLQYIEDYCPGGSQFLRLYFTIVHYYNGYLCRASF